MFEWLRFREGTRIRVEWILTCALCVLILPFVPEVRAASASQLQLPHRGPSKAQAAHAPEGPEVGPAGRWEFFATVGVLALAVLFAFGQDLYSHVKDLALRLLRFLLRLTDWGRLCRFAGNWSNATAGVFLIITRRRAKPWYLNWMDQEFYLKVANLKDLEGAADGELTCKKGRHRAGEWSLNPNSGIPNRFDLHLKFPERDPVVVTVRRPD